MAEERLGIRRINLDLDDELYKRYSHAFDHGLRSQVHRRLLEMACTAVETGGSLMLGAILTGDLTLVYEPPARQTVTPSAKDEKDAPD